uniref:Odorant receptor n=2 Tax=Lutzomyia longipalpis TaxID=7200 RepID=A0A240SXZ1_LUTLO
MRSTIINVCILTPSFLLTAQSIFLGDCVFFLVVIYFCTEFSCIRDTIQQLNNEDFARKNARIVLREVYEAHTEIIKQFDRVNTVYTQILFLQMFTSFIYICSMMYLVRFANSPYATMGNLFSMICQLVLICYCGQAIMNRSDEMADSLYNTTWYCMRHQDQTSVLLLMMGMSKGNRLSAGGILDVSIYSFVQVNSIAMIY